MSGPFVYTPYPNLFYPPPAAHWGQGFFHTTPVGPTQTIYPSSPFVPPGEAGPSTPYQPAPGFFSAHNYYPQAQAWTSPRQRERRTSWHGQSAPRVSPFIPPPLLPEQLERRPSWGNTDAGIHGGTYPPAPPVPFSAPSLASGQYSAPSYPAALPPLANSNSYVSGYPQFPTQFQIHPWINGDVPTPDFVFDVSVTHFSPCRIVGQELIPLSMADLQQSAFYPAITKLRITSEGLTEHWPVDLVYPEGMGVNPPPITLGDILVAIHRTMHTRISHHDFERLSISEEGEVSRAFTRRCRKENIRPGMTYRSDAELPARQQGVKVVDFLRGKNMFRGLIRSPEGYVRMTFSE